MKLLARLFFALTGWKIEGTIPPINKFVVIAAPHTSAWDFIFGIAAKFLFDIQVRYLGKQEIFRFPFNGILRSLGAFRLTGKATTVWCSR